MSFDPIELPPERLGKGLLDKVARDFNLFRKALVALIARTDALYPQKSPTVTASVSTAGTTYTAAQGRTVSRSDRHPFQLYKTATNPGGEARVGVWPGTVDGVSPDLGGVTLDTMPAPLITPTDGTRIVALEIVWAPNVLEDFASPPGEYVGSGGTLVSVEVVEFASGAWPPTETPPTTTTNGTFYQRIGYYIAETVEGVQRITEVENDTARNSYNASFCPPESFVLLRA